MACAGLASAFPGAPCAGDAGASPVPDFQSIVRELGYPDAAIEGLAGAFASFAEALPLAALRRRAREVLKSADARTTRVLMLHLVAATRRAGLLPARAEPHPLLESLVSSLEPGDSSCDVLAAIRASALPAEARERAAARLFSCAAVSQALLVLLRGLGFEARPGYSAPESQPHAFDVVSLGSGRPVWFVDATLRKVVQVAPARYTPHEGRGGLFLLRSGARTTAAEGWSDTTLEHLYSLYREGSATSLTSSLCSCLACAYLEALPSRPDALARAVELTARAVSLDPDSDVAHANFALVRFRRAGLRRAGGERVSAAADLREALDAWGRAQRANPLADYGPQIASASQALLECEAR